MPPAEALPRFNCPFLDGAFPAPIVRPAPLF